MKKVVYAICALALLFAVSACGASSPTPSRDAAQNAIAKKAQSLKVYKVKNFLDHRNYNLKQQTTDDPATILWCTFFPPTPGVKPFTVPIAGKLTSSGKTPFPTSVVRDFSVIDSSWYSPDLISPDAMYGTSSEYRYGFDPTLTQYQDFTQLASTCSNVPKTWQASDTTLVISNSATLGSIDKAAEAALRKGNAKQALSILQGAKQAKP